MKLDMKYRIIQCINPKTHTAMLRPIITGRSTVGLRDLIEHAKKVSYVRGQTRDLEGLLNGFIQAMQDMAQMGYTINVKDWFIVSGYLKGPADETGRLTDANSYHVAITTTKDLQVDIDTFSWSRVDDTGLNCKVTVLSTPGGKKGEVLKTQPIVASGKNIVYDAAWGDSIKVKYQLTGSDPVEIALTPSEWSETFLRFNWPSALANVPAGTALAVTFNLHGKDGGSLKTSTLEATLKPAPTEVDISGNFE